MSDIQEKTLAPHSGILIEKWKFFLNRALTYFAFLLIPVWIHKLLEIPNWVKLILIFLYLCFIVGQWYLLGKEIDHRLKIYFRANSSIERILYRVLLGNGILLIIFNLFYLLLPQDMIRHFFWGVWVMLGIYYSWPTRGKIIEETVSTQFEEYKFLDAFEKTVLFLSLTLFLVSFPSMPNFENYEALKLLLDPNEKIHGQFWNYLNLLYFPFWKYPAIRNLGFFTFLYTVGVGSFLLAFYCTLRYFFSRRLSILGAFAVLSSWSLPKLLEQDNLAGVNSGFGIIWIWANIWAIRSGTYRAGLFLGMIGYIGTLINEQFFLLFVIQSILFWWIFLKERTKWFRRQIFKYASFGLVLASISFYLKDHWKFTLVASSSFLLESLQLFLSQKAFLTLSLLGVFLIMGNLANLLPPKIQLIPTDKKLYREYSILFFSLVIFSLFFWPPMIDGFFLITTLTLLSLIPIELLFQTISRMRSKRNMIFLIYILVCLLDSHFEGRLKILSQYF